MIFYQRASGGFIIHAKYWKQKMHSRKFSIYIEKASLAYEALHNFAILRTENFWQSS